MSRTIIYDGEATKRNGAAGVRLRTVALPNEHGGWGLTLEPVVLGLLVAPSWTGLLLGLATLCAFLARHPFKIVSGDLRRRRRFPRTRAAERFLALYAFAALGFFAGALALADGYALLLPLAVAAPLVMLQLAFDAAGRSRTLLPELAGSLGLAGVSTSIALADGWTLNAAFGLWAVLAARVLPSILFVRAQLDQLHGERPSKLLSNAAHIAAFALIITLALLKVVPALAALGVFVLTARAALGFTQRFAASTAKQVGFREIAYGTLLVFTTAAGYLL